MKKAFFFSTLIAILSLSCKKSSDAPPASTTSEWTYDGVTHTSTSLWYDESLHRLYATDNYDYFIIVYLGSQVKPTANAHLAVIKFGEVFTDASQCYAQVGNTGLPNQTRTTGKVGDSVMLTVSASGKLTASFSNITVTDGANLKPLSGTLREK